MAYNDGKRGVYTKLFTDSKLELCNRGYTDLLCFDADSSEEFLQKAAKDCEFVFHLAGVNRPEKPEEFRQGNVGFTAKLLEGLRAAGNKCSIVFSSSTQAERDNPYGLSKREAEDLLFTYAKETGAKVLVYRLPNVFGKGCRPNYNSAVATFCYNLTRGLPFTVNDPLVGMQLVYIDDVVEEFIAALEGREHREGAFAEVPVVHQALLGDIACLLQSFAESRKDKSLPKLDDAFTSKIYSTFISYLPPEELSYALTSHVNARGSFTEVFRTPERGQFSMNISKPGIVKGHHWHHSKTEKFLVVSGQGEIRFRKVGSDKVYSYVVSGEKLEVVDIPPGYTHCIENTGKTDMVTLMWASECFDPEKPDTFFEEV